MAPRPPIELFFDRGTLVLHGAASPGPPWAWDQRVETWRRPARDYAVVREQLSRTDSGAWADRVPPPPRVAFASRDLPSLRPEQQAAVEAWRKAGGRGVIVMPTGTGKTEVALAAMAECRTATLVVAPVRDLMYQWHQRILRRLGVDAGIVGDSLHKIMPVTVTTYDSAYIHMAELGDRFGLVIFDEAHHLPGRSYREAAMMCAAPLRMGLSATPERPDGRHVDLDELIGPVVYRQEISQARGRTLADYEVVRIAVHLSDDEQQRYEAAGRIVRQFITERRAKLAEDLGLAGDKQAARKVHYSWEDVCAETGSDPAARRAMVALRFKQSIEDRAAEKLRVLEDLFRLHAGERILVFAGTPILIALPKRSLRDGASAGPETIVYNTAPKVQQVLEALEHARLHGQGKA